MYLEIILFSYFMITGLQRYIKSSYGKFKSNIKLNGKTVIITGANSGLGKYTALALADRGAKIILACRNEEAANRTRNEIIQETGNENVIVHHVDFESLDSVREFSKKIYETEERVDILINNAGAMGLGEKLTKDNLHIGMQVNYFAPFLLTNLLLDLLKRSTPSRIVNVTSTEYKKAQLNIDNLNEQPKSDYISYCNAKFCNILMSMELAKRLTGTGVTTNVVYPGHVDTNIFQHSPILQKILWKVIAFIFFRTPKEGAQTILYAAVADELQNVSGKYFADCKSYELSTLLKDEQLATKLWEQSEMLVGLKTNDELTIEKTN